MDARRERREAAGFRSCSLISTSQSTITVLHALDDVRKSVESQNATRERLAVWPDEAHALGLTTQTMAPAISCYHGLTELRDADRRADHTHDVRRALGITLPLLDDAETGQRRFLLTGDPSYLEPYRTALPLAAILAGYQQHAAEPTDPADLAAAVAILAGRTDRTPRRSAGRHESYERRAPGTPSR